MAALPWQQFTERMVGRGHPTLADTNNRALRALLSQSGYDPDGLNTMLSSFSQTVNVGSSFFSGTREARVTAAIALAGTLGWTMVYVPIKAWDGTILLPYDARLVTFNAAVQMLREGGNPITYDIQAYGADRLGVLPADAAVQAAINGASSGGIAPGGIVWCGNGIWNMVTGVSVVAQGISIIGETARTSQFAFSPTSNNQTCITFDGSGAFSLFNCSLQRVGFSSSNTSFVKTMVKLIDVRHFLAEEVISFDGGWHDTTNSSIGLWTQGREYINGRRCQWCADRPQLVDLNPKLASNNLDMCRFELNQYTVHSGVSHYSVECVDGSVITSNEWVSNDSARGIGAFLFNNTLAATASQYNKLENFRQEQGIAGATYSFDIESTNAQLQFWRILGCASDVVQSGIKLRRCNYAIIDTFAHAQAAGDALNVDATCTSLNIRNFFYQTGATVTGLATQDAMTVQGLVSGSSATHQGFWTRTSHATGIITPAEAVLVSGIDARQGNQCYTTLTAARLVGTPLNPTRGQRMSFEFIQGGAGGFAVTWNAVFKVTWSNAGNVTGARASIAFIYDGSNWNQDSAQAPYV